MSDIHSLSSSLLMILMILIIIIIWKNVLHFCTLLRTARARARTLFHARSFCHAPCLSWLDVLLLGPVKVSIYLENWHAFTPRFLSFCASPPLFINFLLRDIFILYCAFALIFRFSRMALFHAHALPLAHPPLPHAHGGTFRIYIFCARLFHKTFARAHDNIMIGMRYI